MRAQGAPIWPGRGTAVRLVLLVLTGLCVFGGHAYAQTDMAAEPYLFGDWGGTRTRLQDQGVRFDFQYVSDTQYYTNVGAIGGEAFVAGFRTKIDF